MWGVPCTEIRAEWAAQRIKGLSFLSAAKSAFLGNKGNKIKSLISEFHYPRFGPGPDVGDDDRRHPRSSAATCASAPRSPRIQVNDEGLITEVQADGDRIQPLARDLLAAAARHRRLSRPEPDRACSTPPRACATATSSPSRS